MLSHIALVVPLNRAWERHLRGSLRPGAKYLFHVINSQKQKWQEDRHGFVNLRYDYLRKIIGQAELKEIRDTLEQFSVIEWRRSFTPGQRSMGYRLTAPFEECSVEFSEDQRLLRRLRRQWSEDERWLLPVHRWLWSCLKRVQLDEDSALSIVSELTPDHDSPLGKSQYQRLLRNTVTTFAEQLRNGVVPLRCDHYGRVHTPITRLPKPIRCCLSIDGRKFVSVDLKNSQPLFCGIVASAYERASKQKRSSMRQWQATRRAYGRQTRPPCSITAKESSQVVQSHTGSACCLAGPGDLSEYIRNCLNGQFYEVLNHGNRDRSEFKKCVFRDVFFGSDRYPSAVRTEFQSRYPTLHRVIADLKSRDHRVLAWRMQSEESTLFIGRTCRRLMKERFTAPLVTVHDCLATTEDQVAIVERVVREEFEKHFAAPSFHIEGWE